MDRVRESFEGDYRLHFHLAPPLLARRNANGELIKREYGPWMMRAFGVLARMRGLRGTFFDPFGRTAERRSERALIDEYERTISGLLPGLNAEKRALAVQIASVPEQIRGFGHVKERNLEAARLARATLLEQFSGVTQPVREVARV